MEFKIYFTFVAFIFGIFFGSFFNVVGWRLPKGLSIVKPRSFCPKCNHQLKWYELIPLLSFIIQGGKCRECKTKIPRFYFIIELLTGILYAISFWVFGFSYDFIIAILVASFFVIVVVSDTNYLVIPDEVTIFFSIIIVLIRLLKDVSTSYIYTLHGVGAFGLMYLLMIFASFLFKREALGGGDIKLMFFIGCAVQPWMSLVTIFLSSFIALPLSLIFFCRDKNSIIPYGPFLLLAAWIIVILKIDIVFVSNLLL